MSVSFNSRHTASIEITLPVGVEMFHSGQRITGRVRISAESNVSRDHAVAQIDAVAQKILRAIKPQGETEAGH